MKENGIRPRKCVKNLSSAKPGDPMRDIQENLGINRAIKLSSNENPLGPSPKALEAMKAALNQVHIYPDGNSGRLREVLSEHLDLKPEKLLFGNGSDEIIKLVSEAFVNPGESVCIFHPSFTEYHFATELMEGKLIKVELDQMKCNLKKMLNAITPDTKLIYMANPNNPTGTIYSKGELINFMKQLPSHVVVVCDEAYHEFVKSPNYGTAMDLIDNYPNILVLRTFSKLHGLAGLRIGYAVANEDLIDTLQKVREPFNVNAIAQVGAVESIKDKDHVKQSKEHTWQALEQFYHYLPQIGLSYIPTQANYLLIDLKGMDDEKIARDLYEKGIVVKHGKALGIPGYIRVSTGLEHENKIFIQTMSEIVSADTCSSQHQRKGIV